ncbi:MAG TPA: site-2 protease family protein [Candidatus Ozemobacteraceae bacterium]|nr:site-2 protease family protein [Candidatus Ozemobacteraceae bacterium]
MNSSRYEFTFRRGGFGGDAEDVQPGGPIGLNGFRKLWIILSVIAAMYLVHVWLSGPGYFFSLLLEYGLLIPIVIGSLTLHEYAHARLADFLGDPTPRLEGRVSVDPRRHLDFLGTLLLFTAGFGWAKPVPVNPGYFRVPDRAMFFVSAAGPLTNLVLAVLGGFLAAFGVSMLIPQWGPDIGKLLKTSFTDGIPLSVVLVRFASIGASFSEMLGHPGMRTVIFLTFVQSLMTINLSLALFNILPVHPLDGSHILSFFLTPAQRFKLRQNAGTLSIVLFMVVAFGLLGVVLNPAVKFLYRSILTLYGI